jgi:short-subunit dehydrogenase
LTAGTALVTGASSGIGEVFARRLAARGYSVVLVARRRARLENIAAQLGGGARILTADLTVDDDLARVESFIASEPRFTLLVNNAGFGVVGRFHQASLDDLVRMHKLHVIAILRLTHAAIRRMIPANEGAVINVSSVAGFTASPGGVGYSATKHWINTFSEGLYMDLKTRRSAVRVQALCPGFTLSEFHDVMPMDRSRIPKTWWTTADEVVDASLEGLERAKLFVVPGWRYRLLVAGLGLLPRSLVRYGATRLARRMKR